MEEEKPARGGIKPSQTACPASPFARAGLLSRRPSCPCEPKPSRWASSRPSPLSAQEPNCDLSFCLQPDPRGPHVSLVPRLTSGARRPLTDP
jgi:hypothetical protein